MPNEIKIFTDGASRGNPGSGGWGAIIAIDNKVIEIGGDEKNTTNNRMELLAVIESIKFASKTSGSNSSFLIYTDSSYVLKGASIWVQSWVKNKWKTKQKQDVLNKDLWQKYIKVSSGLKIKWQLLPGHSGIPANERCDVIATSFADGKKPKLFSGAYGNYSIDLAIFKAMKFKSKSKSGKSKAKPYSYISMVKGVIKTHATWAECEKRVKGVSGTKFQKTFSREDENAIRNQWKKFSR